MKKLLFLCAGILVLIVLRFFVLKAQSQVDQKSILFYKSVGSGSPSIVFLHGMLGSHSNWDKVIPDFSEQHQLITLDLLGFGNSPKPSIDYTVDDHVKFISQTLSQAKISEKFFIVGHSMGAILALDFAIRNPNQILGLVLISPPMKTSEKELLESIEASSSKVIVAMTSNETFGKWICHLHELIPSISYPLIRILEPDLPSSAAKAAGQHTWMSYHGSLRNVLMGQDFSSLMAKVKNVPILIMAAVNDKYTDAKTVAELPVQSNVRVISIDGGHNAILKNADQINDRIRRFISNKN